MSSPWRSKCSSGMPTVASFALSGLVLLASVSQADTAVLASGEALPVEIASDPEVSFWADAAPLGLVIRQLAHLSGRSAEIQQIIETEELAAIKGPAEAEGAAGVEVATAVEELAETEENTEIREFADILVSGRLSGSLGSTLVKLSADYPVVFDLDGETLRAMSAYARSNVSIAMLSPALDEKFKSELLASSGAGNTVEFREDAVRVSGHPDFVKRQAAYITKAMATAEARLKAENLTETTESASTQAISIADSGSTEVLVDIQDEAKPPAEQANLSKPIRWVTDIPGYNTF